MKVSDMKFYHATFAKNVTSIMENGLVPSNGKNPNWDDSETEGFVFLSNDKDVSMDFVESCDSAENGDKIVCFEIDEKNLDAVNLFLDGNVHQEQEEEPYSFMYSKTIPAKYLKVCAESEV